MKTLFIIITMLVSMSCANATLYTPSMTESDVQQEWCGKDPVYYKNWGVYVDCVQSGYAVEIDFIDKWAEAIGQSLAYSSMLNLPPGIAFIIRRPQDYQHMRKYNEAIKHVDTKIKVWYIELF